MEPKHCKITNYEAQSDGAVQITTYSYYERLANIVQEIESTIRSTQETLEQDVVTQLKHIKEGSPKMVLTIKLVDGQPKITKRYVTLKKRFNKM